MRRLKTRLDRLEAISGEDMSRPDRMLLVSVLGRRDALFWPHRYQMHSKTSHCEIRRRQREYQGGQIGVAVKADGRSQWKDASAARQRLIASGMITAAHSSGQVQSVFLTPLGEATSRALVGSRLHTVESTLPVFIYLQILSEQTPVKAVRESVLLGVPGHGDPETWNARTELMLPWLTAGIVTAHSDTESRIAYTPQEVPHFEMITVATESHPDFDDCYVSSFNDERQVLESAEPRDSHEIFIPLPATGWGWPIHFEEANQ